jgi:DNA (cytosine-5)-methyltransferase 1
MKVIDLFSGCGGLSLGFIKAGYTVIKALEYDKEIANTYKMNHPNVKMIVDDIQNVDTSDFFQSGEADIIIGGPPCQGFSMAGARIRNGFIDDPRNYLFKHYFNIVKLVKPKAFVFENVKGIRSMKNGEVFNEILRHFSSAELLDGEPFNLYYRVVNAVEFGIPQKRERMIIIGVRKDNVDFEKIWNETINAIKKENPDYFEPVTVWDAIGNLPTPSENGMVFNLLPVTNYQNYLSNSKKSSQIQNHNMTKHSKVAIERMKIIKSGENFTVLNEKIKSVHSGAYGRLSWDIQSPTITTRFDTPAGGMFTHPIENRTLTPREAARIQSFPDDFVFYGKRTSICKQIGNAVPPKISYFLARFLDNVLKGENK